MSHFFSLLHDRILSGTDSSPRAPSPRKSRNGDVRHSPLSAANENVSDKQKAKISQDRSMNAMSHSVDSLRSGESNRSKERLEEISDIDKRILALRAYLDNARNGILEEN